jgi:hypothetical protein
MATIGEIKIIGLDANRMPRVRKEAYIDLFYQLSEDAPEEWCEDFNGFGRHVAPMAKIDKGTRCFISTYVNEMDTIPAHFEQVKQAVIDCNQQYLEKIRQREADLAKDAASMHEQGGQQFKLNEIIAALDFER